MCSSDLKSILVLVNKINGEGFNQLTIVVSASTKDIQNRFTNIVASQKNSKVSRPVMDVITFSDCKEMENLVIAVGSIAMRKFRRSLNLQPVA